MKKKIAIIGNGTAGAVSAAYLNRSLPANFEIDWYYDPNIKPQSVGEGSLVDLSSMLHRVLGFTYDDLCNVDGTVKLGIHKKYWGEQGTDFYENFAFGLHAVHFNAVKLQKFIFEKLKSTVNVIETNIQSYDDVDASFIFDCRGFPTDFNDFVQPETIPVNSVYVTQCYWDRAKFNHSLTFARKHGWVFGIPLNNRCSIGYMYNNKISSLEEVKQDVQEIFREFDLTPSDDTNQFSFNNYYRKLNYTGRVGYNGNASFFLEPLEATSISFMIYNIQDFEDLVQGKISLYDANSSYHSQVQKIENIIMLHYYAGSVFKTPFWEFANKRAKKHIDVTKNNPEFRQFIELGKNYTMPTPGNPSYGSWGVSTMSKNLKNLGLINL